MKQIFKKIIIPIVFLGVLAWIFFFVRGHISEFGSIRIVSKTNLIYLCLITPVYFYSQAIMLKLVLNPFDIHLKFREWFGLTMITMMGNFIFPFSGLGFRAVYLKKVHNFDIKHFLSTLSAIWIVNFFIFTVLGLAGLGLLWGRNHIFDLNLTLFLGIILVLCLIFFFLPIKNFSAKNKYLVRLSQVFSSWQKVKSNRQLILDLIYWSVLEFFLFCLTFLFAYRTFGFNLSFFGATMPAALTDFSYFFRLLPASFGLYEGAIIYTAKVLGFSAVQALTVTALTRLVTFVWIFTLGLYYSYVLGRQRKSATVK